MKEINLIRLGFGTGIASVLLYIGCVITMALVNPTTSTQFFNSIIHGIDIGPILRTDIKCTAVLFGIVNTFVIAWLFGALIGLFYNICPFCRTK